MEESPGAFKDSYRQQEGQEVTHSSFVNLLLGFNQLGFDMF